MQAVRRVLQRIKMRDTGRADALAEASTYAITHMQVLPFNTCFTFVQAAQPGSAATCHSTEQPLSLPQELTLEALHSDAFCIRGQFEKAGQFLSPTCWILGSSRCCHGSSTIIAQQRGFLWDWHVLRSCRSFLTLL